ncbi:MAG: DUF4330 domain-containing protein [Clostridiales bacterium]|nr:DUF4330 domain-containing protein [Clostridiales bacterium]
MKDAMKKKHKFNIVDAMIILIVVALIALVAFVFLFKGSSFITRIFGGTGEKVEIYYAIEVNQIRESLIGNPQAGDAVHDAVRNYDMGTVVGVLSGDSEYIGGDKNGKAVATKYPGYQSLILIVKAQAVNTGREYSIDGYQIQNGAKVDFDSTHLSATGYCIGLEVVENDAQKEAFWQSTASKIYYAETSDTSETK